MNFLTKDRPCSEGPSFKILTRLREESRGVAVEREAIHLRRDEDSVLGAQLRNLFGRKTSSRNLLGIHAIPLFSRRPVNSLKLYHENDHQLPPNSRRRKGRRTLLCQPRNAQAQRNTAAFKSLSTRFSHPFGNEAAGYQGRLREAESPWHLPEMLVLRRHCGDSAVSSHPCHGPRQRHGDHICATATTQVFAKPGAATGLDALDNRLAVDAITLRERLGNAPGTRAAR